jgi:hypothetical protein
MGHKTDRMIEAIMSGLTFATHAGCRIGHENTTDNPFFWFEGSELRFYDL